MEIVFFSRNGSTRHAAEVFAERTKGASLLELKEPFSRGGVFGFLKSGYQAARGKSSKLVGEPWTKLSNSNELYVITPVWASNPVPAVRTFLTKADLGGRTVHTVTVQADPKHGGARLVHEILGELISSSGGTPGRRIKLTGEHPGRTVTREAMTVQIAAVY